MDLSMYKKGILPTIQDFDTFIKYIEEEKPVLSAKRGVLGKKDSFKLNAKLNFKKDVIAPNYNQDQYLSIDLMFSLAVDNELYVVGNNEKGKPALIKTEKMNLFLEFNNFEKYVFLLENYWSKYKFNDEYMVWHNGVEQYIIMKAIAEGNVGEPIVKEDTTQTLFMKPALLLHHLSYFGLCDLEIIEGAKGTYEDLVKTITPTELGIIICEKLITEGLKFWNRRDMEFIIEFLETNGIKRENKARNKSLFSILKSVFPNNIVKKNIKYEVKVDKSGVYTFKVSLSRNLWRKIRMSHKNTFEDLHYAIQEAFDFDNDHLYEFYIGGNKRNAKVTYTGNPCDGIVDDITIGEANLYKGQKIKYVFDFGDNWEFNITVSDIDKNAALPIRPEIIAAKGQSPEQYPEWWE